MSRKTLIASLFIILIFSYVMSGCNFISHRTISKDADVNADDPEPDYSVSLDDDYQDFTSYIFMGNRMENFSTYFNVYYTAQADYEAAIEEYRTSTITAYNRRLDSLNITPQVSAGTRENLNKVIERASKVIQFHKNSEFLDDAVLLIGKASYYLTDYIQAERKFEEFLSKLSTSKLSDEAVLFLGRTKMKLNKGEEGETILKGLITKTTDAEIRSEAAQELGYYSVSRKNYADAVTYFKSSIGYTNDKERKAEKQYILAKILSLQDPTQSSSFYLQSINATSDFDLTFFAKLNYGKSLTESKSYDKGLSVLNDLNGEYRDYPEYKQQVELEIANNLYAKGKIKDAKQKYFEVIIDYPATVAAADAYYLLAKHYEEVEKDYLEALVNYKKAVGENGSSNYAAFSNQRATVFEKYFNLKSSVDGSTAIVIPENNKDLERYRRIYEEEKGIVTNRTENGEEPGKDNPGGKGGRGNGNLTITFLDSLTPTEDTINTGESEAKKFDSYLELAELFLYDLNKPDSAEHYLNLVLTRFNEPAKTPKVLYTLGVIYKNTQREADAENIFKRLIVEYPNSLFSNEARKQMGINIVEVDEDASEQLYKEAALKIVNKDYTGASTSLRELMEKYPDSRFVPNALYSLGWMYENDLNNKDSSLAFYNKLVQGYPQSEFTIPITHKLEYLAIEEGMKPDSTSLLRDTTSVTDTTQIKGPKLDEEIKENINIPPPGDQNNNSGENEKLSPEEIERMLKETEEQNNTNGEGK